MPAAGGAALGRGTVRGAGGGCAGGSPRGETCGRGHGTRSRPGLRAGGSVSSLLSVRIT